MAPEQAMAKELGPWTDLYSTGVVAYELLMGQVPFSDTETPVAILLRHVNDPPPAPRSIRPDLDEGIEAWLLKMLAKNPADRFQHATDAWDAFEEIVVTVVGPRWRRDARILGLGGGSYSPTPTPLPSIPKMATPEPVNAPPPPPPPATPTPTPPPAAPEPIAAAPVAQVTPPPAAPPPEAPPAVDAFEASEPLPTMAPQLAPQADSFEWPALQARPAPKLPGRSRRLLVIGAGLVVLIGAGIAAAVTLTGGGSSSGLSTVTSSSTSTPTQTTRTTTSQPVLPDPAVPAARRPALIGAGSVLFATSPGGRVARLNGRSLRQLAITSDASRPRALAVLGRTLIVADDKTLYRLRSDTLAPVAASAFGPAPLVGGGGRSPIVAATGRRVCLVGRPV